VSELEAPGGPVTPGEWEAYLNLPRWEVMVRMDRTARLRVHAVNRDAAMAQVLQGRAGVQAMQDLSDDSELQITGIISVEALEEVSGGE
jgi:hypothetical protein